MTDHASPHPDPHRGRQEGVSPHRLNALTDAVFAIAMTLLALELARTLPEHVPLREHAHALLLQLFSYGLGFLILGLFWSLHQAQSHYVERTDRLHTWTKIVFLAFISLIPVTAALLHLQIRERSSVLVYGVTLTAATLTLYVQWWHATRRHRLLRDGTDPGIVRSIKRRLLGIVLCYLGIMAISSWSAPVGLSLFVLLHLGAVFVPVAPPEQVGDEPPAE